MHKKLQVKPTQLLSPAGMMPGEGHPLQLGSTCGTFIKKSLPQPLPGPRRLEAAEEVEGKAQTNLGKSCEQREGAARLPRPFGEACAGCVGAVAGVSLPLEQKLSPSSSSRSTEGAVGWMG